MPESGMTNSEDPLVQLLDQLDPAGMSSEDLALAIRREFFVQDHKQHDFEMNSIHNFQVGLKRQVRAEIALENNTYTPD